MATEFDKMREEVLREYQEDADRINKNIQEAQERANKALEEGKRDRYDTWMASVARYKNLLEIEGRLRDIGLRNVDTREKAAKAAQGGSSGSVGGGSQRQPTEPPKPAATPPTQAPAAPAKPPAKIPEVSTIQFNQDAVPEGLIEYLIFEKIGGHEIINMVRSDSVNGQNIIYSPVANLSLLLQEYNPNNILGLQLTSDKFFENFNIVLETRVPEVGNGLNGANVYLDSTTYDLIIETVNSFEDESVETQMLTSGTIYETILEEYTI